MEKITLKIFSLGFQFLIFSSNFIKILNLHVFQRADYLSPNTRLPVFL